MEVSGPRDGPPAEPTPGAPGPDDPRRPAAGLEGFRARLRTPGSFARSVLTLMTGTTVANLIPVAAAPILARLYGPADLGLFALYSGIAAVLGVAATGRYEMAIVLPADDADAFELLGLSLSLAAAVALATAMVVLLFGGVLVESLHAPMLAPWLVLLPLGVLLFGATQALGNWLNRRKAYRRLSASRILQSLATALLAIKLAEPGRGPGGLILSAVVGQALAVLWLAIVVWSSVGFSGLRFSRAGMERTARRYREFPRINALHAVLDNLASSAMLVVLAHSFGPVVVGHYSMVMRVLTAPAAFIGSAISQVFYQRAADTHNRGGDLRELVRMLLRRTVWIALPGALLLLLAAPELFRFAFGPAWDAAGRYAQTLAPWMFFSFIAAPLAFVPLVLGRQAQAFVVSTTGNVLALACIVAGGTAGSPAIAFGALSVIVSAYFVAYIGWILRIAGRPAKTR